MSFIRRAVLILLLVSGYAAAQSSHTDHTFKLDDPAQHPTATLADVSWLVGSWSGEAFGDTFEEVWNPPSAGSMVGMFKLLKDDQVGFYELMLIVEDEGSLSLKVKHFNDDFSAWEEKKDYVEFPLVGIDEDAIHFSGLSFYRVSDSELTTYLVVRNGQEAREEKLVYHRR
jgi:hypothetical protein